MTTDETRDSLAEAIRALIAFAYAARDEHRRDRLHYLADMLYAVEESSAAQIEAEGARMARAITWAAYLLPVQGGAH